MTDDTLNDSFIDLLHDLIEQFQASVIASFKCITFAIVAIDDGAFFLMITGQVYDHVDTFLPEASSISVTMLKGPAVLPFFIFFRDLATMPVMISLGGPSTGGTVDNSF